MSGRASRSRSSSFFACRARFTQQNLLQAAALTVAAFAAALAALYLPDGWL